METRKKSEILEQIAKDVIEKTPDLAFINDISVIYLESDAEKKSKGRIVYGQCEKIPQKYKWAISADFTITVYTENVAGFTDVQIRILMEHELRHIGETEGKLYVKPHDIEDFSVILEKYGMEWNES